MESDVRMNVTVGLVTTKDGDPKLTVPPITFHSMSQNEASLIELAFTTMLQTIAELGIEESIAQGAPETTRDAAEHVKGNSNS